MLAVMLECLESGLMGPLEVVHRVCGRRNFECCWYMVFCLDICCEVELAEDDWKMVEWVWLKVLVGMKVQLEV